MSEATFVGIVTAWITVGVAIATVMTRRGHDAFSWFVFAILLGPLALPFAIYEEVVGCHNGKEAGSEDATDRSRPARSATGRRPSR